MSDENEEETVAGRGEEYEMMMELERLESLREDLQESSFLTLAEVEAALALTKPGADERRTLLEEIRTEFMHLGVTDLTGVETRIDELNAELDELHGEDF